MSLGEFVMVVMDIALGVMDMHWVLWTLQMPDILLLLEFLRSLQMLRQFWYRVKISRIYKFPNGTKLFHFKNIYFLFKCNF